MNKHGGTITARLLVASYMLILGEVVLTSTSITSISIDCISVSFA